MSCGLPRAVEHAIRRQLGTFAGTMRVSSDPPLAWASVTFAGARHHLRVELEGPNAVGAGADLLALLPDLEVRLQGQVVADLALLSDARRDDGLFACLELEALTIEES